MNPSSLAPNQVRHIKRALLFGYPPSQLARLYLRSTETIRRIKRREHYAEVVVEGEEGLPRAAVAAYPLPDLVPEAAEMPAIPDSLASQGGFRPSPGEVLTRLQAAGLMPAPPTSEGGSPELAAAFKALLGEEK